MADYIELTPETYLIYHWKPSVIDDVLDILSGNKELPVGYETYSNLPVDLVNHTLQKDLPKGIFTVKNYFPEEK